MCVNNMIRNTRSVTPLVCVIEMEQTNFKNIHKHTKTYQKRPVLKLPKQIFSG